VPGARGRFERIVQRHHARLRRVAAAMLTEPDGVDDVLQEAYLRAYRRLPRRFANEAHEAAWLYRVVFRCCLDELRRVDRRLDEPRAELEVAGPRVETDAARLDIVRAFGRLSVEDRAVLLLVDVLGLDYEGAAEIVGVPRGTLAYRLSVARRRLREALVLEGVRDV
jgi:RNA polymerase sigma-70 factor, ECF subfamily